MIYDLNKNRHRSDMSDMIDMIDMNDRLLWQ